MRRSLQTLSWVLCTFGWLGVSASVSAQEPGAQPESVSTPRPEARDAEEAPTAEAPRADSAPRPAPLCTESQLRLVGAIAAPVNSFALVRAPTGTALLSPGERLNGHELLIVGAQQALMRDPTGDPCRLLLYNRSDADTARSQPERPRPREVRRRRNPRKRRTR